jgi:glycosyltransferase involved in cell wall biosynthesis
MPVFNREDFLHESITSVLSQSFTDFELICIDDGSYDSSCKIIREFQKKDSRIRLIEQENKGRCSARNNGLNHVTGLWTGFLDSDDGYLENHLQVMCDLIKENPEYSGFATEQIIGNSLKEYKQKKYLKKYCVLKLDDFINSNPVSLNQFCYNTAKHKELRFPDINILHSEDLLFMRIFSNTATILKVNTITNYVNEHSGRSVNQSTSSEYVKWHNFAAEYFISHHLKSKRIINKIRGFTTLLLSNVYLSDKKKKEGLDLFLSSLKYAYSYTNLLFYKAIIKLIV